MYTFIAFIHALNFLKLDDIYFIQIAKIMHKITSQNWHGTFTIPKIDTIHNHFTRLSTSNYYIASNNFSNRAISVIGPKVWMKIPNDMKKLHFNIFKTAVRNHLIQSYLE